MGTGCFELVSIGLLDFLPIKKFMSVFLLQKSRKSLVNTKTAETPARPSISSVPTHLRTACLAAAVIDGFTILEQAQACIGNDTNASHSMDRSIVVQESCRPGHRRHRRRKRRYPDQQKLGINPLEKWRKKEKRKEATKRLERHRAALPVQVVQKRSKALPGVPNFVVELDRLEQLGADLPSSLKEKKRRLVGQLAAFNRLRQEKGLEALSVLPIRIGDSIVDQIEHTDMQSEKPSIQPISVQSERRNFPERHVEPFAVAKIVPPRSASVPFVPAAVGYKKINAPQDLEYDAFMRSIHEDE
ncbi:unnamed protein product [Sphagnum compactum]